MTTKMTRKEIAEQCSVCLNRKMDDEKGLLCGLTGEYGDFDERCRHFRADEREIEVKKCLNREYNFKAAVYILGLILVAMWIFPIFYLRDLSASFTWTIFILCITGTIAAVLALVRVFTIRRQRTEKPLTQQAIADAVRKEGFYPRQNGNWIKFKIQGYGYDIYYDGAKFSLSISFALSGEEDMDAMNEAAAFAMYDNFMIKILILEDQDGFPHIHFSVNSLMSSCQDLDRFFPDYLQIIHESVGRHRDRYYHIIEAKRHAEKDQAGGTGIPAPPSAAVS